MRAVFETGADLGLVEGEKMQGMKNRLDLIKKPIFLAADFATEEMCSFQDRSDATETPNMERLSHIFRVFEQGDFYLFILILLYRNKPWIHDSLLYQ